MSDRTVDDPNNFRQKLRSQLEQVRALDHAESADAIEHWVTHMTTRRGEPASVNTRKNHANRAKKLHERADRPLVAFDTREAVESLLESFADGSHPAVKDGGLAPGSIKLYRQTARLFFRDEMGHEWAEDIVIGQTPRSPIRREKIFSSDEVDALLDAANDSRDKALISFLTVTGQRITAALSIKLGDVDLGDAGGTITLNRDAIGRKGATGPRPMLWSRPYVGNWIDVHPRRGDPEAPLFCATQSGERPKEDGGMVTWTRGDPLTRSQVAKRIKDVGERAGIDRSRMKPHNFRHTAITRMRDRGVKDDRIRFMVGVVPDSDILERYDQADNETMLTRLREDHGLDPTDDAPVGEPSMQQCRQCGETLRPSARVCPTCVTPLDVGAADTLRSSKRTASSQTVQMPDAGKAAWANELATALESDPEFAADAAELLAEHGYEPSSGSDPNSRS